MSLTKQDLQDIVAAMKTVVTEAVEASEKRMVTRIDEMDKRVADNTELVNDLANHIDERFERVDERFKKLDKKYDIMMNTLDGLAGDYADLHDEETIGAALTKQANDKLDNHEKRIVRLERAKAST
ncbi:hypothetical protein FWG95_03780 [Candidatus Saccharibacteria bacterium]|nr:hypothetical protein [Candidatus Saccharibacteria bacterium]